MDLATEKNFKSNLVKNLQYLCSGIVPFHTNIEIIGHIFMRVDNSNKYNYVLDENIVKTELHGTLLSSKTFPAKPGSCDIVDISNIHPGFLDEQSDTNKTNATNLSFTELEGQTKSMPVPRSVSMQIPLTGMVQVPVSGVVPEWLPAVQIQNVTSLAPGAQQDPNNINPVSMSDLNIQLTKSEASTNDAIFHGTGNVIKEQNDQVKIPKENTSASDILKAVNIKTEPKDDEECGTSNTLTSPVSATPHITVPQIPSTSQIGPKKKRKTSHATRIELEPFVNKEVETGRKKPRIIKSRSVAKKPKPVSCNDIDEGSQSSSGDFVDVPVHFGELTSESTTEEDEVFPISMLKNLSGFEEACNQSAIPIFKTESHFPSNSIMQTLLSQKNGFAITKRGRYKSYSQIEKQNAVTSAEIYGVKATCERLNIPASTLCTWRSLLGVNRKS